MVVAGVFPAGAFAASYYVDCSAGADANAGTTVDLAWQSLEPVHTGSFVAGDSILLKKGCTWDTGSRGGAVTNSSGLRLTQSGTSSQPITLSSYGTGAKPILVNSYTDTRYARIISIEGSYWVVNDLEIKNSIEYGVEIKATATNTTLSNLDISDVGYGINILGNNTKVLNSEIHDTKMIVATANNGDDDYGSAAIVIASSNNEIAHNKLYNNISLSPDYGVDGAAVEFFTWDAITSLNDISIHHNWMENNATVTELGSTNNGVMQNITFHQNVMINNSTLAILHTDQTWGAQLSNIVYDHNSIYENKSEWQHSAVRGNPMLIWFSGSATPSTLLLKNNIIYSTQGTQVANLDTFTHQNNIWYLPSLTTAFTLAAGELSLDPLFTAVASKDFSLQSTSPAINAGLNLGYSTDYANQPIPSGAAYDIGAYEYLGTTPPVESECSRANINQIGVVDLFDYSLLVAHLLEDPLTLARADISGDGRADIFDYSLLVSYFFETCS